MKRITLVLTVMMSLIMSSYATRQEQDLIVVEGGRYYTYSLPELSQCLPDVEMPKFRMMTTANYKGYRASWAIIDKQLYLIGVEGKTIGVSERMLNSKELFPEVTFPFKVTNFDGKIELKGRSLDYVKNGDIITQTEKLILEIRDGKLLKISKKTNKRSLK